MKVYVMDVSGINAEDKKWYKYLSQKRAEKVSKLKKSDKKAQSIGAELLLNYAVNHDIRKPVLWDTDENGKLYLPDKQVCVNLSHSGMYAVCAAHDKSVGVDIQQHRTCDIKTAKRFFTEAECEYIYKSTDPKKTFFEIWTKKESFVKAVGRGLALPLDSFSVLGNTVEYNGNIYSFKSYGVKRKGYSLTACYLS